LQSHQLHPRSEPPANDFHYCQPINGSFWVQHFDVQSHRPSYQSNSYYVNFHLIKSINCFLYLFFLTHSANRTYPSLLPKIVPVL
jgi:hypothetical protein